MLAGLALLVPVLGRTQENQERRIKDQRSSFIFHRSDHRLCRLLFRKAALVWIEPTVKEVL